MSHSPVRRVSKGRSGGAVVIILAAAALVLLASCALALWLLPAPKAHAADLFTPDAPINWTARPVDLKGRHITVKNGTYIFSAKSIYTTREVIDQVPGDTPCLILDQEVRGVSSQYTDFYVDCGQATQRGFVERPDLMLNPPMNQIPFAWIAKTGIKINVRAEATLKSEVLTTLDEREIYEVIAQLIGNDGTWVRLVNPGARTYWSYGWVRSDLVELSAIPSPAVGPQNQFAARLKKGLGPVNVRALYGTQYDIVGTISERKNSYRILSWITPVGDKEWWEIEYGSGKGWIRSDLFDKEQQ